MRRGHLTTIAPFLIVGSVLVFGTIVSIVISRTAATWQEYRYRRELGNALDDCAASMRVEIRSIETAIHSIKNFFVSSTEVTSEEFRTFVEPFLKNSSFTHTLGWIARIEPKDRAAFEAQFRIPFQGLTNGNPANLSKVCGSGVYPFAFAESPGAGESGVKGFDIGGSLNSLPRETVASARNGILTVRPGCGMIGDSGAVLMLLSIDRDWRQSAVEHGATAPPESFAGGILAVDKLLDSTAGNLRLPSIGFSLRVFAGEGPGRQLCDCRHIMGDTARANKKSTAYSLEREFTAAGARWILSAWPLPGFLMEYRLSRPYSVFFLSFAFTVLIALNLFLLLRKNARVQFLVGQRTAELAASEHRLSIIADNIREGFWLYSIDEGIYTYASTGLLRIMGSRARFQDATLEESLECVDPDDRAMVREVKTASFENRSSFQLEYRVPGPEGKKIWIAEYGNPLEDAGGKKNVFAGVCSDITSRKTAEAEARLLEERYLQAQKAEAAGQLAGCVAHDFNNLLTPVISYSELLREYVGNDETATECVRSIFNAGMRARELVRQLLTFSRKRTPEYKAVDLDTIVGDFEELLRKTVKENISLRIMRSSGSKSIVADTGQIEQVIMNLVVNASHAMPDGGSLTVETSIAEIDAHIAGAMEYVKEGKYAVLAVADTGCGMDEQTRKKLFEPFFTTKGPLGTGLGLTSVLGIVKQHGGCIFVDSETGRGTSFRIYLPLAGETFSPIKPATAAPLPRQSQNTAILVVDDNREIGNLVRDILVREKYTVFTAENGIEALSVIRAHGEKITVLITDIVMPGFNGDKLCEYVKMIRPGIRVIYMSAYPDSIAAASGITEPGARLIRKPFSMNEMLSLVAEVTG